MVVILKCRKCRSELVRGTNCQPIIVSAHGDNPSSQSSDEICSNVDQDSLWFLEDTATPWISELISKSEWTKGKLNCPNCEARVGSFDFTSRSKCACGSSVLPAVHLVKSKVDSSSGSSNLLETLREKV